MKKLLLVLAAFASVTGAFARKVTFQLDMYGQTVSADGVYLVGNFKDVNYDGTAENPSETNWTDAYSYKMTETSAGSGIYYYTFDSLKTGLVYEFKFKNGKKSDWSDAENAPKICQVGEGSGNGNRWVFIDNKTTYLELPAIQFGGSAPSGMYAVSFKVDMAKAVASANGVFVAGDLGSTYPTWSSDGIGLANYVENGKMSGTVYRTILYLGSNTFKYKFVNGGSSWESVPGACSNSGGDREITIASDSFLKQVCFGECEACPTRSFPKYKVTFQVDMSTACNWDSVDIAGGKVPGGWGGGTLLKDKGGKIHTLTLEFDSATEVEYKYRKIKAGVVSWEGTSNRKATISSDTTLPLHCYDSKNACSPTPDASDITFLVDMTNEIVASAGVYVMGTFQDPNWQDGAIKMDVHPDNANWYTTTVSAVCPGSFAYKFTNGDPKVKENEESFDDTLHRGCVSPNGLGGFNRTYTRVDANPATIVYYFDSCSAPAPSAGVSKNFIANSEIRVMPNPSEGVFTVSLAGSLINAIEVRNMSGQVVRSITSNEQNAVVDLTGMRGVYLVNIKDSMGRTATQKVVLK